MSRTYPECLYNNIVDDALLGIFITVQGYTWTQDRYDAQTMLSHMTVAAPLSYKRSYM